MAYPQFQADCKRAVSNLTSLSNDELDKVMNDDEKIDHILLSLDRSYLKEIQNEKDELLATNNSMAESNLNREPELVENREKLQQLSEEAEKLSKSVEEKVKQLKNKTGDLSLETALALIRTAASEMEEESDTFAKKFLDSEIELDDFLDQFLAKRKIMHLRNVKAEKLAKLLRSGDPLGNNYMNTPPVSLNTNFFPGIPNQGSVVPYPTGPVAMPMPPGMNYFQNHY